MQQTKVREGRCMYNGNISDRIIIIACGTSKTVIIHVSKRTYPPYRERLHERTGCFLKTYWHRVRSNPQRRRKRHG